MPNYKLFFNVFDEYLSFVSNDYESTEIIRSIFKHLICPRPDSVALEYKIIYSRKDSLFSISRNQIDIIAARGISNLIYYFEKDFTIELQNIIGDKLFFMHGAALERNGRVIIISGRSGAGKSTTTWGLMHHGFKYLSDELAPINPLTLEVSPFPQAVCLKNKPPPTYPITRKTLCLDKTYHIPIPSGSLYRPSCLRLSDFLFIEYIPECKTTKFIHLSESEAIVYIYQNALNQLVHIKDGLAVTSKIANNTNSYLLQFSDLNEAINILIDISSGQPPTTTCLPCS